MGIAGWGELVTAVFLSPHPDDAELFCGATIAALARRTGVLIADLTRGELSSNGTVQSRASEAAAAARALGVREERRQLGLPDAALSARDPEHVDAVVQLLRATRPRLLFAPWVEDRHPDHVATGEIARRARALCTVGTQAEGFASPRLLFYPCHFGATPSFLVDVGETIGEWEAAVNCYASQFRRGPDSTGTPINEPGFLDHHRHRRQLWGASIGVAWAEGFLHDGPLPVSLDDLLGAGA